MNASFAGIRMTELWRRSLRLMRALVVSDDVIRTGVSISCRNGVRTVQILPNFHPTPHNIEHRQHRKHEATRQELKAALHELHVRLAMRDTSHKPMGQVRNPT